MWTKLDDQFHANRKVQRLLHLGSTAGARSRDAGALGLWVIAASWAGASRTDGFVPDYMIDQWDSDATDKAAALVKVGLWEIDTVDGEEGFRFHDWTVYNPPKDKLDRDEAVRRRKDALHKDVTLCNAIKQRDGDRCRYCDVRVNWRSRRGSTAATYDHVDPTLGLADPIEGNTFDNVVVACSPCNSSKGHRTPEEAGQPLLDPWSTRSKRRSGPRPADGSRSEPAAGGRSGSEGGHR